MMVMGVCPYFLFIIKLHLENDYGEEEENKYFERFLNF